MYYHVKMQLGSESLRWWNYDKDSLMSNVVNPFVKGQSILREVQGRRRIINMKNVVFLEVHKTSRILSNSERLDVINSKHLYLDLHECTREIMIEINKISPVSFPQNITDESNKSLKQQVFIIMKFDDYDLDLAYKRVIKPVIEEHGLRAVRMDEIHDSGKITDQMLHHIAKSKYVLADLSGERPNCYYESGYAHALNKELIFTIRASDKIHFDLAGYRFIQWETESELHWKLRERFTSFARRVQT